MRETNEERVIHWFKAADIESILNLRNIRQVIQHFSEKERTIKTIKTVKGLQKAVFLSSRGLYRLLFACKNEKAIKFRDWVGDILDDIIFNESKELRNQLAVLEAKNKKLTIEIDSIREETLIRSYDKKGVVYLAMVDSYTVKFGYTDDIKDRMKCHRKDFGDDFTLQKVIEFDRNRMLEKLMKQHPEITKRRVCREVNNKTQTELIQLDIGFTLDRLYKIVIALRDGMLLGCVTLEQEQLLLEIQLVKEKQDLEKLQLARVWASSGKSDDEISSILQTVTPTNTSTQSSPETHSSLIGTLPPIQKVMENMHEFYAQWACEMRDKYNAHAQEHKGQIKWSKLFPKNEASVMKKRYNRLKHFLNYLDNSTNPEYILQQLEQFAIDNKITHNRLVKDVFYQCIRSETVNAADDIKDAVKNLQTLLDKLNADV
jgi:predicted GIY-YIG superfamily endonuclease